MKKLFCLLILCMLCVKTYAQKTPASINVNLNRDLGKMRPIWAWFGYDEPNYTYMKDGRKLLSELAGLSPVPVYVRAHNLLTTGDGTPALKWGSTNIYTEDADGKPIYNYRIVDSIFDTYVKRGMKPLAQIGFMPKALSTHPEPYQHNWKPGMRYEVIETGWAYPPKDYKKWGELVYQWVSHCVERYGKKEVETWYWEVWNEANGAYWKGTPAEFYKLYDYAADGVKRALPTARIGGPNVTGGGEKWLDGFLRHCLTDTNYVTGRIGSPLDMVLFHAKGAPRVVNDTVVMSIKRQLNDIAGHFKKINSFDKLKNIPIIIGESDPEGCAACGMSTNPENAYRNGTMYSSYTAASFARVYELMDLYKMNLIGAVSWSFEFENQPWFAGFRDLATNGVDKPVLNVFRMLGRMKGNRVEVSGNRMYPLQTILDSSIRGPQSDIGAIAATDKKLINVMVWNYADKDKLDETELVTINLSGLNKKAKRLKLIQYRIDENYSNSYTAWKEMGSPASPSPQQVEELEQAGRLKIAGHPKVLFAKGGKLSTIINMPSQAVALLKFTYD
ncbi:GH39 family glycosyl hydrolase [Mucilaginibacter pedocola]|uniref:Beta-xylosidase n=1 Tax=Mucilaginibacter pedocola TaxID=1792845 RepID=A0A1S9PGM8_9SPHI|nr:beta-xylosidase [Mucilaginibacter pedocola]OOQ59698.1 beta-xylosidase [Mucilaginibacter pedocola]